MSKMNAQIEQRIQKVRQVINDMKLDTLMVSIEENRRYLSQFTGEDTQFDESAGTLFITESDLLLATDSRYDLQARDEAAGYEVVCYKEGLAKELPEILKKLETRRMGFESIRMTCFQFDQIKEKLDEAKVTIDLVPTQDIVENFRMIKEQSEIDIMKASLATAENAILKLIEEIEIGMTEKQAAWKLETFMRTTGADCLSFATIAAFGRNSALPHAITGDRQIKKGEPLLFDWGAKQNGYCSDISRTITIGEPTDEFKKIFNIVKTAQQRAIEGIRPGKSSKEIDTLARGYIDQMGYKDKFGHGLGHGVGMAVHEPPRISPLKDVPLVPGMVFTVEPGIYLSQWGGVRLENMVWVTPDGVEVLNRIDLLEKYMGL